MLCVTTESLQYNIIIRLRLNYCIFKFKSELLVRYWIRIFVRPNLLIDPCSISKLLPVGSFAGWRNGRNYLVGPNSSTETELSYFTYGIQAIFTARRVRAIFINKNIISVILHCRQGTGKHKIIHVNRNLQLLSSVKRLHVNYSLAFKTARDRFAHKYF